ncbi:MAG: hypothetical protein AAF914_00140 [Pseudomonadota bacterium]
MILKHLCYLCALLIGLAVPHVALAWETGEELSEVLFESVDTTGNGSLDYGEVSDMAESIGLSMDSDVNEEISFDEYMAWDFGFAYLAESEGGTDVFSAVKRVMFALIDLDGDQTLDEREWRISTRWNFERADLDGDALLTEEEFLSGWAPIVMLRASRGS